MAFFASRLGPRLASRVRGFSTTPSKSDEEFAKKFVISGGIFGGGAMYALFYDDDWVTKLPMVVSGTFVGAAFPVVPLTFTGIGALFAVGYGIDCVKDMCSR